MKRFLLIFFVLFFSNVYGQDVKIVSLAPSITDEIIDLGGKSCLIGITKFDLKKVDVCCIGDLENINLEKIIGLKPDFVLVKEEFVFPEKLEVIRKAGINVIVIPREKGFKDICKNFVLVAKFLKKEKKAKKIIGKLKKHLRNIKPLCGVKIRSLFVVGVRPIVVVGGEGYINELMSFCCFENVFQNVKKQYFIVSEESVIKKKPEIVFCALNMGNTNYMKGYFYNFLLSSGIVNKDGVIFLNGDLFCRPTPYKYVESVSILREVYEKISK